MKKVSAKLIVFFLFLVPHACFGELFLVPGQTFTLNFTLLPIQAAQASDIWDAQIYFLQTAESWSVKIEFFSNAVSEIPLESTTLSWPGGGSSPYTIGWGIVFNKEVPPPWPNLQGIVRVTDLTGISELDRILAHEDVHGGFYGVDYVAIPEPSVLAVFVCGIVLFLCSAKLCRNVSHHN